MGDKQTTMDRYFQKKGVSANGHRQPPPSILYRPKDPKSREHSDIDEPKNEYPAMKEVCSLLYFVCPQNRKSWPSQQQQFRRLLSNSSGKEAIISSIRQRIKKSMRIQSIDKINVKNLESIDNYVFWNSTVSKMLALCLQAFSEPISLLPARISYFVKVKRKDVLRGLCHMFFCTMSPQFFTERGDFSHWYNSSTSKNKSNLEKIKCLIQYFVESFRQSESYMNQYVSYERIFLPRKQTKGLDTPLKPVVFTKKDIFNLRDHQIVDFANRCIGGGVLKNGTVQEEIMFVVHPELLFGSLLFEPLEDDECGIVHNVRQFSRYQGYSDTFRHGGESSATAPTTVIMIDAIDFQKSVYASVSNAQYHETQILRECHKAYIGFRGDCFECRDEMSKNIATGFWGCGAFKGDLELKFLIQWIAASWADKSMTFSLWDKEASICEGISEMKQQLKGMTTAEVFLMLRNYRTFRGELEIRLSDYILDFYT